MKENKCGLIFNRCKWKFIGIGDNYSIFKVCTKCGTVIKETLDLRYNTTISSYELTLDDALKEIKRYKDSNTKLAESRNKTLEIFSDINDKNN